MTADFMATMRARTAESFRGPWLPYGETIHDLGVALDSAMYLSASHGLTVLRVTTSRPKSNSLIGDARDACEGDWLCDPETDGPNVKLPTPRWGRSLDSKAWSQRIELIDAWETCDRPDWMLHAAAAAQVPIRDVVAACASCALLIAESQGQRDAAACAEATIAWADGAGGIEGVRAARHAAHREAQRSLRRVSTTADMASAAAMSAVFAADLLVGEGAADPVGHSARLAGDVVGHCEWFLSRASMSNCRSAVLRRIPTAGYLRAVRDRVVEGSPPRGWSERSVVA